MTLECGGMPLRISQAKREEAYEKAWSMPMSTLAKEYGITDVALKKRFKAFDIPTPPRGYWAKRAAGRETGTSAGGHARSFRQGCRLRDSRDWHRRDDRLRAAREELHFLDEPSAELVRRFCEELRVEPRLRAPGSCGSWPSKRTPRRGGRKNEESRKSFERYSGYWYGREPKKADQLYPFEVPELLCLIASRLRV